MADVGATDMKYYQPFFNWAIRHYRRLNLAGLMETNLSVMLDVDPNTHCATLPVDYVDYLKVGLCIDGHVVNFTYKEDLCTQEQLAADSVCDCNADQIAADVANIGCGCTEGMQAWWWYPYLYNGAYYGGLYGYSAGRYVGGFKIIGDKICFDSNVTADKVLLEYKSNGIAGAATIVPEGAIGCITTGIHLERVMHNKDRNTRLDIVPYQRAHNAEIIGFRARKAAYNAATWKQIYLQSLRQSIKR